MTHNQNDATLPHPALDRANAGERESEGSQKQEEFCDAHCCWSEHHPDCFRTLPAADPERREGADAAACGVPIPHTFAPPDADTDDSMEGGKKP